MQSRSRPTPEKAALPGCNELVTTTYKDEIQEKVSNNNFAERSHQSRPDFREPRS